MSKNLITGDKALQAIKPGEQRKRISDGEGLDESVIRRDCLRQLAAS